MAEFKTYTCDACGVQGALRFEIEKVDYQIDPADGRRDWNNGQVDLCHKCGIDRLSKELRLSLTV